MLDEQAYRAIGSPLTGITSQHTMTGAFTTGSFSYTPGQLRDLVNEWKDLAADYELSRLNCAGLATVEGPGKEYASTSLASAARSSGEAYARSLKENRDYCLAQAQKFQDTLDDYLGVEHHNISVINKAGPQEGI